MSARNVSLTVSPHTVTGELRLDSGHSFKQDTTTGRLVWEIDEALTGGAWLTLTATGYKTHNGRAVLPAGSSELSWDENGVLVTKPLDMQKAALPRLGIAGRHFTKDGKRWVWKGCTDFLLYYRYMRGEDIKPVLAERASLGANLVRILSQWYSTSAGIRFYPREVHGYYEGWSPFFSLLSEHGLYGKVDCYAGEDVIKSGKEHFTKLADALRPIPNALLSLGNEWQKNGFKPENFSHPGGILFSFGSALSDHAPPRRGDSDFLEFHGRRDWPKLLISSADPAFCISRGLSADNKQLHGEKPFIHDEPIGFGEVPVHQKRLTDPEVARVLAADGKMHGAGATYHFENGIWSVPMGPVQRSCAEAFFQELDK